MTTKGKWAVSLDLYTLSRLFPCSIVSSPSSMTSIDVKLLLDPDEDVEAKLFRDPSISSQSSFMGEEARDRINSSTLDSSASIRLYRKQ